MLKLTYFKANDKFQFVTVIGDAEGIRDLYWQLTRNYKSTDGSRIADVKITTLDGQNVTAHVINQPHEYSTPLSKL
jgi:hypothetical protein